METKLTVTEQDVKRIQNQANQYLPNDLQHQLDRICNLVNDSQIQNNQLRTEVQRRGNLLEDVINELDLSESMIEQHGPMGTEPSKLVRQVLDQKDQQISMLKMGMREFTVGDDGYFNFTNT